MREIDIKEFASLNVRLAKAAGVNAALVHAKIAYYLKINIANNTNLRDGKHWVRFTAEEIQDLLPCLTVKQVRTAIDKLKQRNAIIVGESHYNGPFRTTWYTIPDNILNKAYPKNINPSVTSRELAKNLIKNGDEHAKVMRGVLAWAKITAPRGWWQEFDTYRVGVEKLSSESTMHTLGKRDLTVDDFDVNDVVREALTPLPKHSRCRCIAIPVRASEL